MPNQGDIDHQRNLLSIHRRNLAHYLGQQARLGAAQTPIGTLNGILEERANIKRIKGILSKWRLAVEDHPDDEEQPAVPETAITAQSTAPPTEAQEKPRTDQIGQYEYDLFISYSHVDRSWVWNKLLPRLEGAGLKVVIDDRDFEVGTPSLINMERAVDSSRHTLLVLTPAWCASEWTEFESLLVGTADPSGRRRKLIPLMLERCKPPSRIAMLTYADFTQPDEQESQMTRLVKSLQATTGSGSSPNQGSVLDQRGWNGSGNAYNIAGDLGIGANPGKDELIAALRQIKDELAKAKDLAPDDTEDLESNLDAAIKALDRAEPNKSRAVEKLSMMQKILDGLKDKASSALALGKLIGQAAQAARNIGF